MRWFLIYAAVVSSALACAPSTSSDPDGEDGRGGDGDGDNDGSGTDIDDVDDLGGGFETPGGSGNNPGLLDGTIESDAEATITVDGSPSEVTFLLRNTKGEPLTEGVEWTVDDTSIGSIGNDGVFRANGFVGGVVKITAAIGGSELSTELTVDVNIVQNPGNLPDADQTALKAGGEADPSLKWLYPYDGTVFPRGIVAPDLQLSGASASALYVSIQFPHFSYQAYVGASTPPRFTLPAEIWKGLTLTATGADEVKVSVSVQAGGQVSGPREAAWHIAPASIKGIIYYNTYNTFKAGVEGDRGAIMRIRAGQEAEVLQSGCTVCHTVSANGNVLATGQGFWGDGIGPGVWDNAVPTNSVTYDLTETGEATVRNLSTEGRLFSFAALSPNGEVALVSGIPNGVAPPFVPRAILSTGGFFSRLVNTSTGETIPAPTLNRWGSLAQTPVFSPDGTKIAFIDGAKLPMRVLSVMDFNGDIANPVFSNFTDLVTESTDSLAWPSFLPDGKAIVYHQGDSFDSSGFVDGPPEAPSTPRYAELRMVDLETKTVKTLNAVNGRLANGEYYLPYGEAEEGRMNYEASVLPIPVGGYYWVLFTTRRAYGNTIAPGSTPVIGDDPWGSEATPSPRKKIWIAALDLDISSEDPSHPAFYLPGQELESGNMRAFAALAPCRQDGNNCESGADCCGGFCRQTSRDAEGIPVLECVPPPVNECSRIDELCVTAESCCDHQNGVQCINGRCAIPTPMFH